MIVLYTLLGLAGLVFLVGYISIKEEKRKEKEKEQCAVTVEAYYKEAAGQEDIRLMKAFMEEKKIDLPESTDENSSPLKYAEACLDKIKKKFRSHIVGDIYSAGLSYFRTYDNCGQIYYSEDHGRKRKKENKKEVIIYDWLFAFLEKLKPTAKKGVVYYAYLDTYGKEHVFSIAEAIELFRKIEEPDAYRTYAKRVIPMSNFYWYVKGGTGWEYDVGNAAAGALLGGVLLGPIGVLAGVSSAASEKRKEEKKRQIILLEANKTYWVICDSEYSFDRVLQEMTEHFPDRRLANQHNK